MERKKIVALVYHVVKIKKEREEIEALNNLPVLYSDPFLERKESRLGCVGGMMQRKCGVDNRVYQYRSKSNHESKRIQLRSISYQKIL